MKDMQDVFRTILNSLGYEYPRVNLVPQTNTPSRLELPAQDLAQLDAEHIKTILNEAVQGKILIISHLSSEWEFFYNTREAKDVALQFLKIFEIYFKFPATKVTAQLQDLPFFAQRFEKKLDLLLNQPTWWGRFLHWLRGS